MRSTKIKRERQSPALRYCRRFLVAAGVAGLLPAIPMDAQAQQYPTRPVRFIVGFAPGGANDIVGRILANKLSDVLGQQVVVDNRAGADGRIATAMVAKAPTDGHTIMLVPASFSYGTAGMKNPPYTQRDFATVSLVAKAPFILLSTPSFPASTVKELIAVAKASPKPLSYGTGGVGNLTHLAGELFRQMAGIDLQPIAYRGTGPAMVDLMGGQIPLQMAAILSAVPFVASGKVKAFGVTGLTRSPAVAQVPTIAEAGLPGFEAEGWWAVIGPRDLPPQIVASLNKSINASLSAQTTIDQLGKVGATAAPGTPQALRAFIDKESAKWVGVIRAAKIELQ